MEKPRLSTSPFYLNSKLSVQLEPTEHELLQLRAIRATALTCQRPLEDFLAKISKFEGTLGTFNARTIGSKAFHGECNGELCFKKT